MVLTIHLDIFYRFTQYLQCIVHLDTLSDGHIRVGSTLQQQQRGVYLIGIEQCSVLGKQVRIVPRIAFGSGNGVIGISPIAFAPIARYVADTGMRHGGSKHIGLSLQIHRHKSTVGSADATDTLVVDKRMGGTEFLGAFYDIIGSIVSPGIDVAGGELLSVADGTAGLNDVNHIIARSEQLCAIG